MIKGLTHDESGQLHKITKYRGKISTGYAPNEPPNTENHPIAAGFFRMLKEVTVTKKAGNKKIAVKEWVLNKEAQKALEDSMPNPNPTPRRIEIVSLFRHPMEIWESSLSMYSSSQGLLCKSHGLGTEARYLNIDADGNRLWTNRKFDGFDRSGCIYKACPDFKAGKCKAIGLGKVFPTLDLHPNPYRFETRSINTIMGIESSFIDMYKLLEAAHAIKQMEANKELPFDGMFGCKFYLVHRKIKSGGREVYITDLKPTEEFTKMVMDPIKRGLERKAKSSMLEGSAGAMSLLDQAGQKLLTDSDKVDEDGVVDMDPSDQNEIAVNFGSDADNPEVIDVENFTESDKQEASGDKATDVASTLLNDNSK